jgi:hypothetical protein
MELGKSRLGGVLRATAIAGAYYGVAYTVFNTILTPSRVRLGQGTTPPRIKRERQR